MHSHDVGSIAARVAGLVSLVWLCTISASASAQSQYQYNHPLKPFVLSQSNANVMVAGTPTDGPDGPMKDGAWLASGVGIRDVFENATDGKVPTIRHKPSGLICQNPRVVFAPKQSDPSNFDPANLSGCIERLNGFQVDFAVGPNGQRIDIQSAMSSQVGQIQIADKGFSKSADGKNSTAAALQALPYAWAQFTSSASDEPRLMNLSIAETGDWIFMTKTRCWSDQTQLCRQIGDLALQQAITARIAARDRPVPAADVTELASMFSDLCINAFPDKNKVAVSLASKSATPMSASEVQRYLKNDPGQGWYVKTAVALYGVTIEDPPFHTCAIRRMTPEGAATPGIKAVSDAENAYSSSVGGKTVVIKPTNTRPGQGGPDVLGFGMGVLGANGQPSDSFLIVLSNYHGRVPAPWVADGTGGVGVEVRFTRQVMGR